MNIINKMKITGILAKLFLKGDFNMKNWKTSIAGLIAAVGQVLPLMGIPAEVSNAVTVIGLFLLGVFSKDSNVTNGTVDQGGISKR